MKLSNGVSLLRVSQSLTKQSSLILQVEQNLALGRGVNEPHESIRKEVMPSFEEHNSGQYDLATAADAARLAGLAHREASGSQ